MRALGILTTIFLIALGAGAPPASASAGARVHRYRVSEHVSSTPSGGGVAVTARGKVSPNARHRRVSLLANSGSGWHRVARARLSKRSTYVMRALVPGSTELRVHIAGKGHLKAGTSTVVRAAGVTPSSGGAGGPGWRSISAGTGHTCGIKTDGSLWCWGSNDHGELGSPNNAGTTNPTSTPTRVGTSTWLQVSAGYGATCAVRSDRTAWCWGNNHYGQLGTTTNSGTTTVNASPLQVGVSTPFTSISAGQGFTCATFTDGSGACWGDNNHGQLGVPTNQGTDNANPFPYSVGNGWTGPIQTGASHACGPRAGTVHCWGANLYGQLGSTTNSGNNNSNPNGFDLVGLAAPMTGDSFSCGEFNGVAECWGYNKHGELGTSTNNNTFNPNPTPMIVSDGGAYLALSGAEFHTCGLRADGSVRCWGLNIDGQLGTPVNAGSLNSNPTPAEVAGGGSATVLSAGGSHTCEVKTDGTAWCWGDNQDGELGNPANAGSSTPNPTPVRVG